MAPSLIAMATAPKTQPMVAANPPAPKRIFEDNDEDEIPVIPPKTQSNPPPV